MRSERKRSIPTWAKYVQLDDGRVFVRTMVPDGWIPLARGVDLTPDRLLQEAGPKGAVFADKLLEG